MPWIGVAGSAAAAVAVVVVAVILFQRQGEWLRAPRPGVLGESDQAAPAPADSMLAKTNETGTTAANGAAGGAASKELARRRATPPPSEKTAVGRFKGEAGTGAVSEAPVGVASGAGDAKKDANAKLRMQQAPQAVLQRGGNAEAPLSAARPEAQAGVAADRADQPGEALTNVLRAHRLPALWNPGVPSAAVVRAESDLRYVYQAGHAGADSARIRLYLAEAERARLSDPSNTAAVESISHHYRRAISLARGDAALVATARQRLSEFEQEMIRARGAQP